MLFIDIKGPFDHVLKRQLFIQKFELGIDDDLVTQTDSFLINLKVQLVINSRDNKKREIETRISYSFSILLILFLIHISGVFNKVAETSLLVTSLLFTDDLSFIASGRLVKEIIKTLEKVSKEVIEWEKLNLVTYNTSNIEIVLFFKSYGQ